MEFVLSGIMIVSALLAGVFAGYNKPVMMAHFWAIVFLMFSFLLTVRIVEEFSYQAPECQEDEVIIGIGDFNGDRWDNLKCIPLDDLIEQEI